MNWTTLLVAMSPEHLLLAGIAVMLAIDIVSARPRSHLPTPSSQPRSRDAQPIGFCPFRSCHSGSALV